MSWSSAFNTAVFVACCVAGYRLGLRTEVKEREKPAPEEKPVVAARASLPRPPSPLAKPVKAPPVSPSPPGSELSESIAWLRKLETMPLEEFPKLFEEKLRTAERSEKISQLMDIWMNRDLAGYTAWVKTQPVFRRMTEASVASGNFGVDMYGPVIARVGSKNPEEAWTLVGELPGRRDTERWRIMGAILKEDPKAALEFLKSHREELVGAQNSSMGFSGCDPVQSLPVLLELPEGRTRIEAARELARRFIEEGSDLTGAGPWFESLPPDARKALAESMHHESLYSAATDHVKQLAKLWTVKDAGQ